MKDIKEILRSHPIWTATLTTLITFLFYYIIQFTTSMNIWISLIRQTIVAVFTLFVIYMVAGKEEVRFSLKGGRYGLRYLWWILLIATVLSLSSYLKYLLVPDKHILTDVVGGFILTGLISVGVGLFEEGLFRGLIMNAILAKIGDTKRGVIWAVLISSILFGLVHLVPSVIVGNFTSVSSLTQGLGKALQTASIGLVLAVIYLRTRNLWVVALYHAFNDFVGFWPYYMTNHGLPSSTSYVNNGGGEAATQLVGYPELAKILPYIGTISYLFIVLIYLPQVIFALRQLRYVRIPDWGFFKEKWFPRKVDRNS